MRHLQNSKIWKILLILIIFSLVVLGVHTSFSNRQGVSQVARNYALKNVSSLSFENNKNICEYQIDSENDTATQNCFSLLVSKRKYMVLELNVYAPSRFTGIDVIDQNGDTVESEITKISTRPFEVVNYVGQCSVTTCPASRFFFQFRFNDDFQIKGFRLKGLKFEGNPQSFPIINFDSSSIQAKSIFVDEEIRDYDLLRETIDASSPTNEVVNAIFETPSDAKTLDTDSPGPSVDIDIDFIDLNNSSQRKAFNIKYHSIDSAECRGRIINSRINPFKVVDVCDYLVKQHSIANEFGDGRFNVPLHRSVLPSGSSTIQLKETDFLFFENLLKKTNTLDIAIKNSSDLSSDQIDLLRIAHLVSPASSLENFKFQSNDTTEAFINGFFKTVNASRLEEIDLSNNNMTMTSVSSALFQRLKLERLRLRNNTLTNSFDFEEVFPSLVTLDVKNTKWTNVLKDSLWNNLPNTRELILTGTSMVELTLNEFVSKLSFIQRFSLTLLEAKFANNDELKIQDFKTEFPGLKTLNTPLTNFIISDVNEFKNSVLLFDGDFALPRDNVTFDIVNVRDVFDASEELKGRLKDLNGNSISLYYDAYLSFFMQRYLNSLPFFRTEEAKDRMKGALIEVIGSYRTLFNIANKGQERENIEKKTQNVQATFENIGKLVEAKITGDILGSYIEDNEKIVKQYRLDAIPSNNFTNNLIIISVLITILVTMTTFIASLLILRFRRKK